MAHAIQCDLCGSCYKPNRKCDSVIVFPQITGMMLGENMRQTIQCKSWDLCYDCYEKINTFICSLENKEES